MFIVCLPTRPPHRSLSAHHRSPFNGHNCSSFFFFWGGGGACVLTRTLSHTVVVLLAFLSLHSTPPLSPTHPLDLFPNSPTPHVPHLTFISSFMLFLPLLSFPPSVGLCVLPLLTHVRSLLPHFSCSFFIPIFRSTLPPGWLFSVLSPDLLRFPSFRLVLLLFIPTLCVSDLLFGLASLWNSSTDCPRLLPTTVEGHINIACLCLIDHSNARNTEPCTRQVSS